MPLRTTTPFILIIYSIYHSIALADIITINHGQFKETFTESVNISGIVRIGVMYGSPLNNTDLDSLFIDLGQNKKGLLCASITSIDGQYKAAFKLKLKEQWKGISRFKLPSQYHQRISHYSPNHVAVMAEIKPKCKGKTHQIVPASWGPPNTETIHVFINSGGFNSILKLYKLNGDREKIKCHDINTNKKTAFNTECTISKPIRYQMEKSTLFRSRNNNRSKPIKLPIFTTN